MTTPSLDYLTVTIGLTYIPLSDAVFKSPDFALSLINPGNSESCHDTTI